MRHPISRHITGGKRLLLKAILAVVIVFGIEQLLSLAGHKDEAALSLQPFQSHYFSFSTYYLTAPGLGSAFTANPSATVRFVIYFILSYLVYALVATVLYFILKQRADAINRILFYATVTISFLKAFFFPPLLTSIDPAKKEIRVTTYSWLFVPATKHFEIHAPAPVSTGFYFSYDGYGQDYIVYSGVFVDIDGPKLKLGEREVGKQEGILSIEPSTAISPENKRVAEVAQHNIEMMLR